MSDPQQWRRRPPPRAASTSAAPPSSASRQPSARSRGAAAAMAPTAASSGKRAARKAGGSEPPERTEAGETAKWRELRRSVRVRATMDTPAERQRVARVADLCDEDREKVAQLVRRVVEIGTIHEESEAAFERGRVALQREILELRAQAKKDAADLDELGDKLRSALLSVREHQERVAVLEQSSDAEVRARHEAERTMDMLRVEVDKLRDLVMRQRDEMEEDRRQENERHRADIQILNEKLRQAQVELMQEREDRVNEKQRELEQRLEHQFEQVAREATEPDRACKSGSGEQRNSLLEHPPDASERNALNPPPSLDISSFLNTSIELPDTIRAIMDEWKQRMEEALAEASRTATAGLFSSDTPRADQPKARSDENDKHAFQMTEPPANGWKKRSPSLAAKRYRRSRSVVPKRLEFEESHGEDGASEAEEREHVSDDSSDEGSHSSDPTFRDRAYRRRKLSSRHHSRTRREISNDTPNGKRARVANKRERKARSESRKQSSPRLNSNSNSDRGESSTNKNLLTAEDTNPEGFSHRCTDTFESNDGQPYADIAIGTSNPKSNNSATAHESSFVSLYETSLFDVVDAIESVRTRDIEKRRSVEPAVRIHPAQHQNPGSIDSPEGGSRMDILRKLMEERERRLVFDFKQPEDKQISRRTSQLGEIQHVNEDAASIDDFVVFDAVKELYSREVFERGRRHTISHESNWKARINGDVDGLVKMGRPIGDGYRTGRMADTSTLRTMLPPPRTTEGIREAIETDLETLLREEPLVLDLSSSL